MLSPDQAVVPTVLVADRLLDLELSEIGLKSVVARALLARRQVTHNHAKNAAGTMQYHEGVPAIREAYCDDNWQPTNEGGLEGIENKGIGVRVYVGTVDRAASIATMPQPASVKGPSARIACAFNAGQTSFDLNRFDRREEAPNSNYAHEDDWQVYYLLMDPHGGAELSKPVIASDGGGFTELLERIFIETPETFSGDFDSPIDYNDDDPDLDIPVTRKL